MANYTLNFDNAYADCLNVTLINFKANADYIKYTFSITQITLNISKASYLIHIASSNIRICTQSDLSAYSNSFLYCNCLRNFEYRQGRTFYLFYSSYCTGSFLSVFYY